MTFLNPSGAWLRQARFQDAARVAWRDAELVVRLRWDTFERFAAALQRLGDQVRGRGGRLCWGHKDRPRDWDSRPRDRADRRA